ncbi:MAG TPA: cell wall hydrolase [Allosphingosinicella sp.]|nr:cell wall hydrolase [Allosphingosinicella sp.]
MSELALSAGPDEAEGKASASIRGLGLALVCVALAALWFAAALALVQGGRNVAVSQARGAAPAVQPAARLQARAEAMTATQVRQISAESAEAINASVPVVGGANPAAVPFTLANSSRADRERSLDCLTAAIYYESATEPLDGQRAVAQVILNRVRHPAYPNTVCGVVFEGAQRRTGCQFSFTCDGSLRRQPMPTYWGRSRDVAAAALNGYVYAPVGLALNYHANYVVPYWSSSLVKNANVGLHIFYRWRGNQGRPDAFTDRYAGAEPVIMWRGGFGQPTGAETRLANAEADRQAAAIAAAEAAMNGGRPADVAAAHASVDSFQRSVLRRYEPLQRESAAAVIDESTRSQPELSSSQRWALTGQSGGSTQQPLGRRSAETARPQPPSELQGVRRRGEPAPATPAPAGNNESGSTAR